MQVIENFYQSEEDFDLIKDKISNKILGFLDEVPQKIEWLSSKDDIVSDYVIYSYYVSINIISGNLTYLLEPNTLVISKFPIVVKSPQICEDRKRRKMSKEEKILIFKMGVRKNGYRGNLLMDFSQRGISDLLFLIFNYLSIKDLRNLYLNNPFIFTLLIKSPRGEIYWKNRWQREYGTVDVKDPLKMIVQLENEIKDLQLNEKCMKVLIKYNADVYFGRVFDQYLKLPDVDAKYLHLFTVRRDSPEILKIITPHVKGLIPRGPSIGPKIFDYITSLPDQGSFIFDTFNSVVNHYVNLKTFIHILTKCEWKTPIWAINQAINHLKNGENEKFVQLIIEHEEKTLKSEYIPLKLLGYKTEINLINLLVMFIQEKDYHHILKFYTTRNIGDMEFEYNPRLVEYLIKQGRLINCSVDISYLSQTIRDMLKDNGYKILVNVFSDGKEEEEYHTIVNDPLNIYYRDEEIENEIDDEEFIKKYKI